MKYIYFCIRKNDWTSAVKKNHEVIKGSNNSNITNLNNILKISNLPPQTIPKNKIYPCLQPFREILIHKLFENTSNFRAYFEFTSRTKQHSREKATIIYNGKNYYVHIWDIE